MVVDFTEIKRIVHGTLDHQNLNAILPFNPTAENIAYWICNQVPHCYKVDVQETSGNIATYERDWKIGLPVIGLKLEGSV